MKKVLVSAALVFAICVSGFVTPQSAAAQSTEEAAQIKMLTELISLLQTKLQMLLEQRYQAEDDRTQSTPKPAPVVESEPKLRQWLPTQMPDSRATVSLENIGPATVRLTGTLYPAEDCRLGEFEYWIEVSGEETQVITFDDCDPVALDKVLILQPHQGTVSVAVTLRFVDRPNNVWMFSVKKRFSVDLTNPLQPIISDVTGQGKKG